ncbi:MAG TPA: hypothetical protein VG013_02740 [Gemmataceae bacterium]|nr:hypothetical protein [Gemmataceae bacterium]
MARTRRFLCPVSLALGCLIWSPGCRPPPASPMQYAGTGSRTVGPSCVTYVEWGNGLALAVWCDFNGSSGGGSGGGVRGLGTAAEYQAHVQAADGRRVGWKWLTPDNSGGTLTLDGTDYDLTAGRLFLVSTKGGKAQVRQFRRDLSKVQPAGLERLAKSDADVAKFVTGAAHQK